MLITSQTQCIIQGITGKEGQRALAWMTASGLQVVAGVTPGKGGQTVVIEGSTQSIPVYHSVADAKAAHPTISVSAIYVPPQFVLAAAKEAIAAQLALVHILAEGVPSRDTATLLALAQQSGTRIVGPSSIGLAVPGLGAIGSMGGGDMSQYLVPTQNNGVAIISKSGGMANTIATMLTKAAIPQSLIIGIGGDRLIGTTYADLLPDLANDPATKAVVIIGEIGGAYEEVFAEQITEQQFTKPVIAFISGLFAETLPQGISFGHAGAIVSKTEGTRQAKITALTKAGVQIAQKPSEIVTLLKNLL
jgi:succinyl-CoA synthetase alpha subunit